MPGRGPHGRDPNGRDHWDDEEEARRSEAGRGASGYDPEPSRLPPHLRDDYPDPGHRADYASEHGLTRQDREAIGGSYAGYGAASAPYAPTAEQAVGRRGGWDWRRDPGAWFGHRPPDARFGEGPHRGRGPKGYTRSGERIREDVCDRLTDDAYLDASDVEVSVTGTEVTLSGTVDSRAAKRRAEDHADDVLGVTHVQNNLRVRPAPGTMGAQTDPVIAAVADGKDADQQALELREERDERSAHPPR